MLSRSRRNSVHNNRRNFSLSPPDTVRAPALARRASCPPPQVPRHVIDVTVPKDARSKRFGVEQELPKGRPRTIMLALTATYYTPGARSPSMGTPNLLNYVETVSNTYVVQQLGSTSPLPSTRLLLLGQGTNVFVADLAWSFDGYETTQIDHARDHANNGETSTAHPLADVADRLVRHDGYKDDKGKSRGVLKTRFMPLERWFKMVRYLSERTPQKALKKVRQNAPKIDPMEVCAGMLMTLGTKSARVAELDDPTMDAEILEPLRRRFVVQIAPFMARDDTVAPESRVVPAFEAKVKATGIPGISQQQLMNLFKRASKKSLSVDPAPMAHEETVDPNLLKNYQNALHGIINVVDAMAQCVQNNTGDPLGHLFKRMATDSPFSQFVGAERVDASGNALPPLQVTAAAMLEASNDSRYRCFAGGDNAHVVKKRADSLLKALKLLTVTVQLGGHLVSTDSWLDKTKRATANMGAKVSSREVPIRFATVFPGDTNTWRTCEKYLNDLLAAKAPSSSHEVDSRFKSMNTTVRVDGFKATTDMRFMTTELGRTGKLDALKWLWQIYVMVNHKPTPAGFVQTLLQAPLKSPGQAPALTFGECLIRAYMCWVSRACLLLKGVEDREDVLPKKISASSRAKSQQAKLVVYGAPLRDLISALFLLAQMEFFPAGPNSQPLRPAGMHALHGLRRLVCARYIWELGCWKIIMETGLRIGYIEMINICTKSYRESLEPEKHAGQPELRRGFWFIHWESQGTTDPIGNIVLEYNDSKTVGADQSVRKDKFERNSFRMVIRRAGTWIEQQFAPWLPLFIDAYYLICGSIDRPYTSSVHDRTNHNLFGEMQCKNFVTPAMPRYNKYFAKLTQTPSQDIDYKTLFESKMGGFKATGKTRNYKPHLDIVRANGAEPTLFPPRDKKWDHTLSTAAYNNNTAKWLESQMVDHCELLCKGSPLALRPSRKRGDKGTNYYNFQDIEDVPCEFLGNPRARKKSKSSKKPVPITKNTVYTFDPSLTLQSLIGMPVDQCEPTGPKWDAPRVQSLQLTMEAIWRGELYPSCTFGGRQHNISVMLAWQQMMLAIPHITARHGAAELLQCDIDKKLAAEAHLGINTVKQAYTKILQIPLGHPTVFNDLINNRVHGHPTPAVWSVEGKLRVPGDQSTLYYIESFPETLVPTIGNTDIDVCIRLRERNSHSRLTKPEQNANIFFLSVVKYGIQWTCENQVALRGFRDGSESLFNWLEALKRVPSYMGGSSPNFPSALLGKANAMPE